MNLYLGLGMPSGTSYRISDNYKKSSQLFDKALYIGIEELRKRGEL